MTTSCTKHEHCFTGYWKLDRRFQTWDTWQMRQYLVWAGYFFSSGTDTARLQNLCTRAERGLISNDRLNHDQLLRLCVQREITIPPKTNHRILALRTLLEAADNQPCTFTRFALLPTEIRLIIYDFHIAWLRTRLNICDLQPVSPTDWHFVAPPPLAQVSRALREEFLPEFYDTMNFQTIALPAKITITYGSEDSPLAIFRHKFLWRDVEFFRVMAYYKIDDVLAEQETGKQDPAWSLSPHNVTHPEPHLCAGAVPHYHTDRLAVLINRVLADVDEKAQLKVERVRLGPARVLGEVARKLHALSSGHGVLVA
ncbi:hypothetical protein DOTSEDRAFT_33455 [Dothistroma septosporum NZE10]|uniref:2EXR domain-containing protein n=1 Tax=Dothistroma septosporum (strain NZE10 / CBS 128990) TaxID=675120 RepID=N1PU03_DOTSN|nr:hypothetical protein DOTSEDRAFT_33455 [Dothistroma septosporum NZE10]